MKKILITTLLLITTSVSTLLPAYAIVVFDPSNFGRQLINYAQQGLQLGKETVTAGASVAGTAQQTLQTVNDTVLIPARDTLTLISVIKSGQMIQNLVLGSLGVDPLLVRNPEKYIQGKGEEVVRGVVEDPEIQNSLYDASVLKSVIDQSKYDSLSLSTKIKTINQSSIPQLEQRSRCTDQALSAQAIKDVSGSDGSYTQTDYAARKRELSNALCGDVNDPNTKTALLAVAKTDMGWDSWLAMTEGDNDWNRSVATKKAIADRQAVVENEARTDLENGKGIRSETKCTKLLRPGDDTSPCLETTVLKTADILNSSFKDALSSPLKMQMAGFGKGAGSLLSSVASLASTAFSTIGLINGVSAGLGGDYTGNPNSSGNTTSITHTSDLKNNAPAKEAITNAPKEQLTIHRRSLGDLVRTDTQYLTAIASQKSSLLSMKTCYDTLVNNYPGLSGDGRVSLAQNFYTSQINNDFSEITKITTEKNLALTGENLIDTTLSKIENSQSSEDILDIFLRYQDELKKQNIPDITTSITRDGEYISYVQRIQQRLQEGGDIYGYNTTCASMNQEQLGRNNGGNGL